MRKLWYSPTLRSVLVYGASGLGFAGANLILARFLSTQEYAVFTLVMALANLGYALAPAGVDGIVNRRRTDLRCSRRLDSPRRIVLVCDSPSPQASRIHSRYRSMTAR